MSKLTKEKRNQLVLATLLTATVLAGLWFTLIRYQQTKLDAITGKKDDALKKMAEIRDTIKNANLIQAELLVLSNRLDLAEGEMASGDLYASMYGTVRKFKIPYNVDIPGFSSEGKAVNVSLLPKFPYKQVTMTISGTARYHDLGQFVCDFENRFPTTRILNVEMTPNPISSTQRDLLAFKMDVVSLVKPADTKLALK